MLDDLCKKLVEKYGAVVDAAIHAPHKNSGSDERNYHAHIMFTTRSIDLETGEFSAKKFRDFNKEVGSKTVKNWRSYFADLTNLHLEKAGFDIRVDHRSKLTKITKHAKRHFWLNDVCTCHGLLPSHSA